MTDRKKVIIGLEGITDYFFDICRNDTDSYNCAKAQEYSDVAIDAISLLKEQEAVKPELEHSGSGVTWWNVCGNCKTAINPNDKFCHECGKPVLWEGSVKLE